MVHEPAKHQRRNGKAHVQPGIHRAVDTPGGPFGRGAFDQHVAARAGHAHRKTGGGQHHRCPGGAQRAGGRQHQQRRAARHGPSDHRVGAGARMRHKTAHRHAHRATHHVGAHRQRGGGDVHTVHLVQNGRHKTLDHRQRHGREQKERKAPPHHRQLEVGQIAGAGGAFGPHHHRGAQTVPLPPEHRQHTGVQHRRAQVSDPPVGQRADAHQKRRRQCPTEIARQTVHRKPMAQALGRHPLVQDGEIGRVKRRIAQTGQHRHRQQPAISGGLRGDQAGQQKQGDRGEQHRPRADAVHHKTRQGLPGARDDKKHAHEQAHIGKAQAKVAHKHRKQRRQQQVRKVRGGVRQPHEPDHGRVFAPGGLGHRGVDSGSVAHGKPGQNEAAPMVIRAAGIIHRSRRKRDSSTSGPAHSLRRERTMHIGHVGPANAPARTAHQMFAHPACRRCPCRPGRVRVPTCQVFLPPWAACRRFGRALASCVSRRLLCL